MRSRRAESQSKDQTRVQYLENFDGCLKRLQTDHVEILLCHGTRSAEAVRDPVGMEALAQIKKDKKAHFIGIATHSNQKDVVNAVVQTGFYDVVLVSFNFTMSKNEGLINAMKNATDKGLGVIAMKTQAGGGHGRRSTGPVNQTAALKWVLQHEFITTAIPGFTNYDQLEEDFSVASDLEYNDDEKKFLSGKDVSYGFEFCQQCSECVKTCPQNVDIPTLMRTHMYAARYANFYQARSTIDEIPSEFSLMACTSCSKCTAKCVRSVNIAQNIDELKMMYV